MATRYNINDFALANPAYAGGTVSFYTVSGGAKTTTLATLYAASTGSTTLANPRTLDSDGKFSVPVYVEVPTVATVSGLTVADHDTGIMGLAESAAATSAAAAAVSAAAALVSENNAETAETNAVAAVATIGHRKAASVAGTSDAITAVFSPVFASLAASAGIVLAIPLTAANATTTPTLAIDGLTAKTIVKNSGAALVGNSIPGADFVGLFVYDASLDKFQMLNPTPVLGAEYQAYDATLASLAGLTLSQGALLTATGADAGAVLAKGTALQVLRMNAGATAPEWAAPIFSVSYSSGNQTISNAGLLTLAHGLGVAPKIVQFFAVCLTGENNWTAGAVIPLSGIGNTFNGAGSLAVGFAANVTDATNITVRFAAQANPLQGLDATSGALAPLTSANWALLVRAYA